MSKLISWFEIPSGDFDRAVNFYKNVLLTDIQVSDCGNEKMGCFPNDGVNVSGAVIWAEDYQPSKHGVIVSFYSEADLNTFLERVTANGGQVVTPKTKIQVEGAGYFAVFNDTEGNRLGVYSDL